MKKITFLFICVFTLSLNSQTILLSENFDDITTLTDWDIVNVSNPIGTIDWFQGADTNFPSQDGIDSYISCNFNSTAGTGTISDWLILPVLSLKDDDVLRFFTRTVTGSTFPDRLQVRISANGAASAAPVNDTDLGDYTTLLLDINSTLAAGGYPEDWELQAVTITGLGGTSIDARLAFRYFVTDAGPNGSNSNLIGIDTLEVEQTTLSTNEFNATSFKKFYNSNIKTLNLESTLAPLESIVFYNILGQEILDKTLSNTIESVDMSSMVDGIYLAKVTINGNSKTFKILKQ